MDIFSPVLDRLTRSSEADIRRIAEVTGVPKPTIDKIKFKQTTRPQVQTVQKLYAYLFEAGQL